MVPGLTGIMTTLTHDRPAATYDPVWQAIHWLMAILFLTATGLGYYASTLPAGTGARPGILGIHKSIGLTLFALVLIRLAWRLSHPHPSLPSRFGRPTRIVSNIVHGLLYVIMLGMPLSGYVSSIAGGYPTSYFGLFAVPALVPKDKAVSHLADQMHVYGSYAVYALVALHIAAALWHAMRRDGVLDRMLTVGR